MVETLLFLALSMLTSFDEARFLNSQKQIYDSSCGYASVATVMNWYNEDIDELKLIHETLLLKTESESKYNTTLRDLMTIFEEHGYYIKAFKMDYNALISAAERYAPLIAHFQHEGKGHFLLVLCADENTVLVSDPSSGTYTMFREEFEKDFSGNVLLIHNDNLDSDSLEKVIDECSERLSFLKNSRRFL